MTSVTVSFQLPSGGGTRPLCFAGHLRKQLQSRALDLECLFNNYVRVRTPSQFSLAGQVYLLEIRPGQPGCSKLRRLLVLPLAGAQCRAVVPILQSAN